MMYPFFGFMGGLGSFGSVFMILFWGLVIYGLFYFLKRPEEPRNDPSDKSREALDILKERFAKGEIDKKEFEERKKVLLKK